MTVPSSFRLKLYVVLGPQTWDEICNEYRWPLKSRAMIEADDIFGSRRFYVDGGNLAGKTLEHLYR